jgi:kynureninase
LEAEQIIMDTTRPAAAAAELSRFRSSFPLLDRVTYFNACSLGPLPRSGAAAVAEFLRIWDEQGAPAWFTEWIPRLAVLRRHLEQLLHAPEGTVALAPSVSVALATSVSALLALTGRRKVLVGALDFPTLGHQFLSRPDLVVEFVPSPDGVSIPAEEFAARIDEQTAIVATTHVLYSTGAVQDVRAIADAAHRAGAYCLIDGYQSVGCLPVRAAETGADVFIAGCLKWLSGGPGTAFTYCSPELLPRLRPQGATGWMAGREVPSFDLEHIDLAPDARRLETGTWPVPSHMAALAGLDLVLEAGTENIKARLQALTDQIIERCEDAGLDLRTPAERDRRCGIVSISCQQPERVVRQLSDRGLVADERPGVLRLSPHWAISDAELDDGMDRVLDVLLPPGPRAQAAVGYPPPLDRLAEVRGPVRTLSYGIDPEQFAELWRPAATGPVPVVALIHGGYWRRRYRLDVMNAIAHDLCSRGYAVYNVEYRRVGCRGGGWPGTFDDVTAAMRELAAVADAALLDLNRVVVAGHSAGGQLALCWAGQAGRSGFDPRLVISLAGVCDPRAAVALGLSKSAVHRLHGGTAGDAALRSCSPLESLPLGVDQLLVHGPDDDSVPFAMSDAYHRSALAAGDACELIVATGSGHFDVIDPVAPVWASIAARIDEACKPTPEPAITATSILAHVQERHPS